MGGESRLEARARRTAVRDGWLCRKLKTHNNRGAPDRMFLRDGRVLFVEFKAPDGILSKLQIYEHKQYAKRGITVHVIDDVKEFKALIS